MAPRAGRAVLALAALAVPLIVVIAVVVPVLAGHHRTPRPAPAGGGPARSTLAPAAQRVAASQLAGRAGAVVAIDPQTGAVRVMYGSSGPGNGRTGTAASSPLAVAAQSEYPPGATFDVVTAAAALDSGRYTPGSRISGRSPLTVDGVPIENDAGQSFGHISLADALDFSVNTVFAQVGNALGRHTMSAYMQRFGFYAVPPLVTPRFLALNPKLRSPLKAEPAASGVRIGGRLTPPTDPRVELGRLAIGQGGLAVTPVQMAMVAAAIADGGDLIAPHLALSDPAWAGRMMKPATAAALTRILRDVVRTGTGTPVDLAGLPIAGKTGTAQVGGVRSGLTDPWFIGFAPANHPTIAIAVVLKNVRGGYGGVDAAPIAERVILALLAGHR